MLSHAKCKYIRISPYKLRPMADVIRGYSVDKAYAVVKTFGVRKAKPILKALFSAYSNDALKIQKLIQWISFILKNYR